MARVEINLVAAVEQSGGIGKDGGLPWNLPSDWNHFLRLATRSILQPSVALPRTFGRQFCCVGHGQMFS